MWQVLINSLSVIAALAFICVFLVKRQGRTLPAIKTFFSGIGKPAHDAPQLSISIKQRAFLGWKSSIVDVEWQQKRYLLVVQEGRCTVVDCISQEPLLRQQDNE